uniref:Xanthine dehydrogenase/oxidase n=1 Tax=Pavo cristatus TaxID=9049 RepID=A0A8C9G869_PAVCR
RRKRIQCQKKCGCGACTVMISKYDPFQKKILHHTANACLFPICALHHVAVTTVEGIGNTKSRLHPAQERIAKSHGSQCGFCTPGIVMSMYTLLRNKPKPKMEDIEDAFQGNLCRCTGYRPILEGYRTFAVVSGFRQCSKRSGRVVCFCNGRRSLVECGCCEVPACRGNKATVMSSSLFDSSEFQPLDPTQEPIFPPELMTQKNKELKQVCFKGERVMWIQPTTLQELVTLKSQYPNAKLVVGNTEVGIEMRLKNMLYPVILAPAWIPEMNAVQHTETGEEKERQYLLSEWELQYKRKTVSYFCSCFSHAALEQLRWFAGPQIRNVAALGGNIMTASPISDLNPVLMASGSKLTLISTEGKRTVTMDEKFFTGYRKTIVKPEEVLLSVEIPYSKEGEYFSAFKQAYRREDDIAIVTCGMRVLFQHGTSRVQEVKLSYGGMAPTTILALKTCQELTGRDWNEKLLQDACHLLAGEMDLSPSAPGGMVEFRRTLTLSFFFKFYLTVLQKLSKHQNGPNNLCEPIPPNYISATELFHKDPIASTQLFQEVPRGQLVEDMVGRPLVHVSAAKQACGEAVYCDDIPHYENELYLTLVTSTKAHAKILSVDASEAQSVPGFVCFVSAKDVPGSNITGIANDETVFAEDVVTCVGHIIGAVIADTQEHSRRAAKAVKIKYEELKPIVTIQVSWLRSVPSISSQSSVNFAIHTWLFSHVLHLPSVCLINVSFNRIGRPVRCMLDRDEDMLISGGRHPFLGRYKVGFMKNGKVKSLEVSYYSNGGNSADLSHGVSKINFLAGALIHVYTDGSVLLTHGGTEMGQGLHTKMIQVASRSLGIPTSKIYISETSTNTVPNTSPTAASVSADINGMAVHNACQTILKRLEPIKQANPKGSWEDWIKTAYENCISLSATGFYRIPDVGYNFETNKGKPFHYFSYGVACSEVEIDCLTGDHKNIRTDIVMDVGTSLNPAIDIGQIEGAFVQGIGLFTMEELRYSPEGNLYTRGPGMYKIPAFGDIPTEFYVSLLRDCPNSKAIYSSKAVGEPPLFLSASVFYAIKDAIYSAREDSGVTEPFRLDSPATPERIRNACVDTFTKMCPSAEPGTFKPWSVRV